MFRYLAEPRNILAEALGSAEPRLKNTGVEHSSPSKNESRFIFLASFRNT